MAAAQGQADYWSSYMADSRHSGVSSLTITGNFGNIAWKYGLYSQFPSGSPIVDKDGFIYQAESRNVLKLDSNGGLIWSIDLHTQIQSDLALAPNGTIYACGAPNSVSLQRGVFAISPYGALLWNWGNDSVTFSSPVVGSDGTVFVGTAASYSEVGKVGNSSLIALNPNGQLLWQYNVTKNIVSSPAISPDGRIVVVSAGQVLGFNKNGTLDWTSGIMNGLIDSASVSINPSGQIFVKTNNSLVCLEPNGTVYWTRAVDEDVGAFTTPACTSDRVFIPSGKVVYCFDDQGNQIWKYSSKSLISISVIVSADGWAIFASGTNITALDTNGMEKWKHAEPTLTDEVTSRPFQPVLAPDGRILISSDNSGSPNYLYAIGVPSTSNSIILWIALPAIAATVILALWFVKKTWL